MVGILGWWCGDKNWFSPCLGGKDEFAGCWIGPLKDLLRAFFLFLFLSRMTPCFSL